MSHYLHIVQEYLRFAFSENFRCNLVISGDLYINVPPHLPSILNLNSTLETSIWIDRHWFVYVFHIKPIASWNQNKLRGS